MICLYLREFEYKNENPLKKRNKVNKLNRERTCPNLTDPKRFVSESNVVGKAFYGPTRDPWTISSTFLTAFKMKIANPLFRLEAFE